MRRSTLILAAAALDWTIGDPESLPHPVRLIGAAIAQLDASLHPETGWLMLSRFVGKGGVVSSKQLEFAAGTTLTTCITTAAYLLPALILHRAPKALQPLLEILFASTTLAARNLDDEAHSVLHALKSGNLPHARLRLSRIVGRDTAALDQSAISRALIETLAESLSDGIIAPLFFLALGGVPAAMAFKAVSTMDSMIGHRTPRYLYFGRPAAHLDDAANFLPARLTALALLAFKPGAFSLYLRDCRKHASPNAGHPESAMAAVLGVQLGGPSTYAGEPHNAPLLNPHSPLPTTHDAHRALVLTRIVAVAAACFTTVLLTLAEGRRR